MAERVDEGPSGSILHETWGFWAHLFLTVLRRLDPQIDEYDDKLAAFCKNRLALTEKKRIVDVGCGAGDVARRLTKMGHDVVAIDISQELIDYCKSHQQLSSASARYQQGDGCALKEPSHGALEFLVKDMRKPFAHEEFDGAICLGVTFGYFSEEENLATLKAMADALKVGGTLLIESDNPLDLLPGWVDETVKMPGVGKLVMRRRFNCQKSAYEGLFHLERENGEKVMLQREKEALWDESIRIYKSEELAEMAAAVGLAVNNFWGSATLPLQPYGPKSSRLVLEATKVSSL